MGNKKVSLDRHYSEVIVKALSVLIHLDDKVELIVTKEERDMAITLKDAIDNTKYREVSLSLDSE
tara:strand:+ start:883 stop:1077 length:195 start_codon:yes stop_codon:yes gene_type:complete